MSQNVSDRTMGTYDHAKHDEYLNVANDLRTCGEDLTWLATNTNDLVILRAVASNPNTPADTLAALGERKLRNDNGTRNYEEKWVAYSLRSNKSASIVTRVKAALTYAGF